MKWLIPPVLVLLSYTAVLSQTAGPLNSTNIYNEDAGDIDEVWANPNLARLQDDVYATVVTTNRNDRTQYLIAKKFGFNIPAGSSIDGIVVQIDRYATATNGGSVDDNRIRLVNAAGTIVAGSDKSAGLTWPTSDTDGYQSYGGVTDTWSITDWTAAKINNDNFGVAIMAETSNTLGATFNLFIDHIRITVHYTSGGAQRYAVATGLWGNTSSWATTPGGTPGASVPTSINDVFIGGGFTITQNLTNEACNSLTIGTAEANPVGVLTFNNADRDIAIGVGGLVITANGDIASAFAPRLTTAGDFTLNKVLTNRNVDIRMDGATELIISGTGSIGDLDIQSATVNTGTLTITSEILGDDDDLVNGSTATIIFSGTAINATIDLSTPGNTIEFATTTDFNIHDAANTFHHVIISGTNDKSYSNTITINGDLTITATGILDNADDEQLVLLGNWINNNGAAGFVPGTCTDCIVNFEGGNSQTITNTAGEQFYRMYVNKTAGTTVSALNNIVVSDRLRMTEGIFDVDSRTLTGAAELDFDGGELIIGTTGVTVPQLTGTYQISGGTVTFDGVGAQTIRGTTSTPAATTYINVQFLGSGTKTLGAPLNVNGNLTIGGTAALDVSGSNFAISLEGNWTNTGTFNEQSGTLTLDGNVQQTITNASGETFHNLTINNSTAADAIVLNNPITVNNTLTLTDGHILSTATNLLTLNASATVASVSDGSHVNGPVSKIKNTIASFSFPVGDGTNYQSVAIVPTSTSTTTYLAQYFAGEQSQGTALGAGVDHISSQDYWFVNRTSGTADAAVTLSWEYSADPEINNTAQLLVTQWNGTQWTSRGNAAITGNNNAGTVRSTTVTSFVQPYFVIGSSTTNNPLSNNRYFVAATGNWDGAGVWAYRPGGAANASTPTATKNVIIQSGNTVTILDATVGQAAVSVLSLTVNGTLAMSNSAGRGVVITVGSGGLVLGTNANVTGGDADDRILMGGDITLNNISGLSHTTLEVNFTNQGNTISGTGSLPFLRVDENNQQNIGNVTFTTFTVENDITNDGTITITGALSGDNNRLTNNATGIVRWQGISIASSVLDATTPGNIVQVINTTGGSININNLAEGDDFHHLTIGGTSAVRFSQDITVAGNLTIEAGAILDNNTDDQGIDIGGNWINNNGAGGFLQGGGDIVFEGNTAQSIYISAGIEVFENLEIDNSSSTGVTITNGQVQVTTDLQLIDGILFTSSANLLILSDNSTSDEGSMASFVDGPMKKIGNDPFTFPVGDGGMWARLRMESLANFGTNTEFTCQYINNAYSNTVDVAANITGVSTTEHWLLSRDFDTGNNASCLVRLYWEDLTASGIDDISDLRVAHYYNSGSGDRWHNFGGTYTDNGDGTGDILSTTTFTSFSPITFASEFGFNPLPVELVDFTLTQVGDFVEIHWSTASETDNERFEIERFSALDQIENIGTVEGHGTTNEAHSYTLIDKNPLVGKSYYRLKQVDFSGEYQYSDIRDITIELSMTDDVSLFPNPGNGSFMNIKVRGAQNSTFLVTVLNQQGVKVATEEFADSDTDARMHFNTLLAPGIYIVHITSGKKTHTRKLIVNKP